MENKRNPEDGSSGKIRGRSKLSSGLIGLQSVSELKKEQSRNLRKSSTYAEQVFWEAVRNRKCAGLKFRRQQVVHGYIADFYCEEAKLVVELDGIIHEDEDVLKNDEKKNTKYKEKGLYTLRFKNSDILERLDICLEKTKTVAALRMHNVGDNA